MTHLRNVTTHLLAAAVVLALFGATASFAAWTGPTAAPPNSNASAPINVGTAAQVKNGALSVNTLAVFGNSVINNTSPTLFFQDSDNRSAMIHNNSNLLYFLGGCGNGSLSWCQYNSRWPLVLNLENNYATFGGDIDNRGSNTYSNRYYDDNTSYYVDANTSSVLNYAEIMNGSEPTINFHRPGVFATGIKLKSDNKLWFGGWSAGEGAAGIVAGNIRSSTGGFTFPDGTVQTTAAGGGASVAPGSLCGIAYGEFGQSLTYQACPPLDTFGYTSIATCNGQSITSSCPSGYTMRTIKTGSSGQSGSQSGISHCVKTCSKN